MPADVLCYVLCCGYTFQDQSLFGRTDKSSIAILRANIQLYFVKGSYKHGKRRKDGGHCACKRNQEGII